MALVKHTLLLISLSSLVFAGCTDVDDDPLPSATTAGAETTTAGAEATAAGAEATTAGAETTTAGAETTTAGADTTTAGAETTTAGAEAAADSPVLCDAVISHTSPARGHVERR